MKRIVCCSFCKHFIRSDYYNCSFCALKHHSAEPDDRCTFGEESK